MVQKKAASSHSTVEVRLNRALEEAERYKTALLKERTEAKVLVLKGEGGTEAKVLVLKGEGGLKRRCVY